MKPQTEPGALEAGMTGYEHPLILPEFSFYHSLLLAVFLAMHFIHIFYFQTFQGALPDCQRDSR